MSESEFPNSTLNRAAFTAESLSDIPESLAPDVQVFALRALVKRHESTIDVATAMLADTQNELYKIEGLYLTQFFDNQQKQLKINELLEMNRRDQQTGLLNSESWKKVVDERMSEGKAFAIWQFDIRFFKLINDTYGHHEGDNLILQFSDFLTDRLNRQEDILVDTAMIGYPADADASRTGGDEFGFLTNLGGDNRRPSDIFLAADHENQFLSEAIVDFVATIPKAIRDLGFNISMGPAVWDPRKPVDRDTLLRQADEAMYEHKEELLGPLTIEQIELLIRISEELKHANINPAFVSRYASTGVTTN